MNGPEHYRIADNLLNDLDGYDESDPTQLAQTAVSLQFAQVHATLALAAATVDAAKAGAVPAGCMQILEVVNSDAWRTAVS